MFPSFSRDGRSIVYTTWDDEKLGSIRVVPADGRRGPGGRPRSRATTASRCSRRTGADRLPRGWRRLPAAGRSGRREQGLYRHPAATGGKPRRLVKDGEQPHFGAAHGPGVLPVGGGRREGGQARAAQHQPRRRATSARTSRAREWPSFRVSPDEQWVAFRESFNAYVMPLPARRQGGGGRAKDARRCRWRRCRKDAGEYLHWSGDSKRLLLVAGARAVHARAEGRLRASWTARRRSCPSAPEQGLNIGFQTQHDVPAGTVALVGGRVITMQRRRGDRGRHGGDRRQPHRRGGPARRACRCPTGAKVIDVRGQDVMPGHRRRALARRRWASDGILPQQSWVNYAALAFGVTTLHDPSNATDEIFAASELAKAGLHRRRRASSPPAPSSTARKAPFKAPDRDAGRRALAPAAHEGGRRVQREELQPAAARPAAAGDRRRRASCR